MRFQSYFNSAIKIIQSYDGSVPLQHYLKSYFSVNRKHGSKDRKFIAHLCYNFYRLGKSFSHNSAEEKLKIAIFLCNDKAGEWSLLYEDDWLKNWSNILNERIAFIQLKHVSFLLNDIFPFTDELSKDIHSTTFLQSFFIQPDVFLRTRPDRFKEVTNRLIQHSISFNIIEESCIALSPFINLNRVITLDEEAVVQDYSSQRIKEFLLLCKHASEEQQSVWDCCAGSGGKSILAYDTLKNINLTVSDVRASILQNLKERFIKAGIKNYKSFIIDVVGSSYNMQHEKFDLIICDAPCTGSGTWSRTPEQLYFFQPEKINTYALLQQKIIGNTISSLKDNGFFLYITCSVFAKENKAITDLIKQQFHLKLIKMELLKGYSKKADTMFAALFRKTV